MNFEKALSILGLSRTYTEEDLRKAHRLLVKKYHPDLYENKSEREKQIAKEKMQEANTAKDYLEKCLKDRTSTNTNSTSYGSTASKGNKYSQYTSYTNAWQATVFHKLEESFNNELLKMWKELDKLQDEKGYNPVLNYAILGVFTIIDEYQERVSRVKRVSELMSIIEEYYKEVEKELDDFAKQYAKECRVDITKETLEKYSLKKLYTMNC